MFILYHTLVIIHNHCDINAINELLYWSINVTINYRYCRPKFANWNVYILTELNLDQSRTLVTRFVVICPVLPTTHIPTQPQARVLTATEFKTIYRLQSLSPTFLILLDTYTDPQLLHNTVLLDHIAIHQGTLSALDKSPPGLFFSFSITQPRSFVIITCVSATVQLS